MKTQYILFKTMDLMQKIRRTKFKYQRSDLCERKETLKKILFLSGTDAYNNKEVNSLIKR
jgi:hypothetical protein